MLLCMVPEMARKQEATNRPMVTLTTYRDPQKLWGDMWITIKYFNNQAFMKVAKRQTLF